MRELRQTTMVDDYVFDVLMRDLVGHDKQPAAFLVYLWLYRRAARQSSQPVAASLRMIADETGLSKSATQLAIATLQKRKLISTTRVHATAIPKHTVLRPWRRDS
jgi:DNA-binding MarR family transcriptional regulator